MPKFIFADTETFSVLDLKKVGSYKYATQCEILLFGYATNKDDVKIWDCTAEPMPADLIEYLKNDIFVFHNANFDRTVLRLGNLGIDLPINRVLCTMSIAYAHSLPGSLDKLGEVLGIAQKKLHTGRKLINLFCKPRPIKQKLRRATRETHPAEWAEFIEYCSMDITAMQHALDRMPRWNRNNAEGEAYASAERLNDRGFAIDRELCEKALALVADIRVDLLNDMLEATSGAVESALTRDKLIEYIFDYFGVLMPDMRASSVEKMLDDPATDSALKTILAIRLKASASSVTKFGKIIGMATPDNRVRGTIQFRGASRTGRDAGRGVQPQNFASPDREHKKHIDDLISLIKSNELKKVYGDIAISVASNCLRSAIVAPAGYTICAADLSNIEGRGLAWLAGEAWKLQAFRDFDAGTGADIYVAAYAKTFSVSELTVGEYERQLGKVLELALGYGGGYGAFLTFALAYNVGLTDLAGRVLPSLDNELRRKVDGSYDWFLAKGKITPDTSRDAFMACEALKIKWREAHPSICGFWRDLENAWRKLVVDKNGDITISKVSMSYVDGYIRIRLPSGRFLCYFGAGVASDGSCFYCGVNQKTFQWSRLNTYGGKLAENITQAFATDVFKTGVYRAEKAGFLPVLLVHDELVAETTTLSVYDMIVCLVSNIDYAPGLPLAAKGFQSARYRKN